MIFSSNLCVQTGSGVHPASCTMGTGGSFPGGKARPRRDADHSPPHLMPRPWKSRSYTSSLRLYDVLWDCFTFTYSRRKITESLWNVTVRGEKDGKSKGGARLSTVCLSIYSITENIYYSQLSSVVILIQPETVSHRKIQEKCCLSFCAIVLRSPPPSHVSIYNG
jgi:hypothetical protein